MDKINIIKQFKYSILKKYVTEFSAIIYLLWVPLKCIGWHG